jgi:FdhD protein
LVCHQWRGHVKSKNRIHGENDGQITITVSRVRERAMNPFTEKPVEQWRQGERQSTAQALINEEPLSIRVQGEPYAVVMRTPGRELDHVAGFCLAEGIVDRLADFNNIAFCDGDDTNTVTVTLRPQRAAQVGQHLDRRSYISQTSCGICGKAIVDDLVQVLAPSDRDPRFSVGDILDQLEGLRDHQQLRAATRAAHAALIADARLAPLVVAEDVGRHNALDKAVGTLFRNDRLPEAALLVLSSRISYELVQKAARAQVPVIAAISRPTSLAVNLAERLNITLVCRARPGEALVFCHAQRLLA